MQSEIITKTDGPKHQPQNEYLLSCINTSIKAIMEITEFKKFIFTNCMMQLIVM